MLPKLGSFCELCPLPAHYSLTCPSCASDWEEPSFPGEVTCPHCGATAVVGPQEHAEFKRLVLATRPGVPPLARCEAREPGVPELAVKRRSG